MAVTIISSKYVLFEKLGIPSVLLGDLKAAKIKLAVGFKNMKLVSAEGAVLVEYAFPPGISPDKIMKSHPNDPTMEPVKAKVMWAINYALDGKLLKDLDVPPVEMTETLKETNDAAEAEVAKLFPGTKVKISGITKQDVTQMAEAVKSPFKKLSQVLEEDPILKAAILDKQQKVGDKVDSTPEHIVTQVAVSLKDAKLLYQPVRGTGKDTRYFTVAMNDDIKVAARITGNTLSMRVEGNLTPAVRQAFKKVMFDDKGMYLSRHANIEKTTPERVVGATLFGTGVAFDTPIPNMEIIRNAK